MVCYLTQNMETNGLLFNTKHGNKILCYLTQNMKTKWFI